MCLKSESEWFEKNEFQKQFMIKLSGHLVQTCPKKKVRKARNFSQVVAFNPSQEYVSLIPNMVFHKKMGYREIERVTIFSLYIYIYTPRESMYGIFTYIDPESNLK